MPLALVVHASRPVSDVSEGTARRLVAGKVGRWSDLDQDGGRLRMVGGGKPDGARPAREALRRVRGDRSLLAVLPARDVDATVRVLTVAGRHPLRDPDRYPLATSSRRGVGSVTTLTVVGDVMLARRVGQAIGNDPERPFRPLRGRLARADITVGNLESSLSTDGTPTQGGDSFGARTRVLQGLESAGFDLVSLANNHLGDYGERAMRQTFDRLEEAGIAYVGAGRDLAEASKPVVVERDGVRVGFLGTESIGETPAAGRNRPGTNRLNMPPRTGPLDRGALRRISADIRRLSDQVDTVVVLPHWGTQYTHVAETSQRTAAAAFTEAGADLVLGGHPHWVQGWEQRGSGTVVHSLGNFVFDMDFSTKTREGVFVEVVLWDGQVKAVEPVAYVIDDDFTPRLARDDRGRDILADVWRHSRGPFARP
jgi:poly-gamma-glutamate synthesis protein (capsule biosynthesis protein)